jgi:hypothetical protein
MEERCERKVIYYVILFYFILFYPQVQEGQEGATKKAKIITLLDAKRSNNISIMLSKIRIKPNEIAAALEDILSSPLLSNFFLSFVRSISVSRSKLHLSILSISRSLHSTPSSRSISLHPLALPQNKIIF